MGDGEIAAKGFYSLPCDLWRVAANLSNGLKRHSSAVVRPPLNCGPYIFVSAPFIVFRAVSIGRIYFLPSKSEGSGLVNANQSLRAKWSTDRKQLFPLTGFAGEELLFCVWRITKKKH